MPIGLRQNCRRREMKWTSNSSEDLLLTRFSLRAIPECNRSFGVYVPSLLFQMMVQRAVFVILLLFAGRSIVLPSNGVWSSIGPFDGLVNSIAIDVKNLDTVYVANSAGIFKTTDGGASWSSINPGVYPQVLVLDPRDSQTVFAGTASGILKSVDGGTNWHSANSGLGRLGGYQGRPGPYAQVSALTIDPQNADILY